MEKERGRQAGAAGRQLEGIYGEKLVLASASPRRAEILRTIGCSFETLAVNIDESHHSSESAADYVQRLAQEKAGAAAEKVGAGGVVIGADTVVVVDEMILGKPRDGEDARRMLRLLSGRWHEVLTGVALVRAEGRVRRAVAYETTRVQFASVSDDEIDWYVATNEPMDKAGAYAVQGRAALFIEKIEGDYWNVVGLPIQLVYKLALRFDRHVNGR